MSVEEAQEYVDWFKASLPSSQGYAPGYARKLVEAYEILLENK